MHLLKIRQLGVMLLATTSLLTACDHNPGKWKKPNMTALTPRLQPMFEKIKTVCFGRFMVDVPASAAVAWGGSDVPLGVSFYPNGVDEVNKLAQEFIDKMKNEKAINHNDIPLLISIESMTHPEGRIVTGYEDFQSIDGLKINGYFRWENNGFVIDSRPMREDEQGTVALIKSIAQRLRQRSEDEAPTQPGNCIEYAFLADKTNPSEEDLMEHIRVGFRLKEVPDAHFSIYVAPSNPYNPERDSLQAQWKRIKEDPSTPEEKKALASIKYFRESPRQIHDWKTGYEVLVRNPDEEGVHSYHDFQIKFTGIPHDPFRPYADIQFQTGVANNAAGATKASLTDEEAIAVWDKITSTIRVRPTSATPVENAGTDPHPQSPLGELAATGRTCPQTGWWMPSESDMKGGQRQHIKAGDRMPHMVSIGEPSLWQKLKGERPSYRAATVWKLVAYGDAPSPTQADAATSTPAIAQAAPENAAAKASPTGTTENNANEEPSPKKKG